MKILIDLQSAQSGSRIGGIGRYSTELAKAMLTVAPQHDYWIMINDLHFVYILIKILLKTLVEISILSLIIVNLFIALKLLTIELFFFQQLCFIKEIHIIDLCQI